MRTERHPEVPERNLGQSEHYSGDQGRFVPFCAATAAVCCRLRLPDSVSTCHTTKGRVDCSCCLFLSLFVISFSGALAYLITSRSQVRILSPPFLLSTAELIR